MTQIQIITPFGDTVLLHSNGQFEVTHWADISDRYTRLHTIGNWLNLEWWPMVFATDWTQLQLEDI